LLSKNAANWAPNSAGFEDLIEKMLQNYYIGSHGNGPKRPTTKTDQRKFQKVRVKFKMAEGETSFSHCFK